MEITPSLQLQSGYLETSASRHLNVIIMEKKLWRMQSYYYTALGYKGK